jgi:sugar phosphate permease
MSSQVSSRTFWRAWMTWAVLTAFYCFQFFLRSSTNAFSDQIMRSFQIENTGLGVFAASYYWAYAACLIPIGIALDLYGPKRILRIGLSLCILGTMFLAGSNSFALAIFGRFLIGAGAASSFVGSLKTNRLWFSGTQIAFVTGLISSSGKMFGALSNIILPLMLPYFASWKSIIWVLVGVGCLILVLIWVVIKNGPEDEFVPQLKKGSISETLTSVKKEFLSVITSRKIWMLGLYAYSMYLTLSVFAETYSNQFLRTLLKIDVQTAGKLCFLVPIGGCIGTTFLSFCSDYFAVRRSILRWGILMTLFFSSMIFYYHDMTIELVSLCLFGFGFFSGAQVLVFAVSSESFPKHLGGMATGSVNAILMLGGSLHNPLFGMLLQRGYSGGKENNVPVYALSDYRWAFFSITLCLVAGFVMTFFFKETHPKRVGTYD